MKINDTIEIIKFIKQEDEHNIFIIKDKNRYYKYIIPEYDMEDFKTTIDWRFEFIPYHKCKKKYKLKLDEFLFDTNLNIDYNCKCLVKIKDNYSTYGWMGAIRIPIKRNMLLSYIIN